MPEEVDARLRRCLKRKSPLAPFDASRIQDNEVAAKLFDPQNRSFNDLMRSEVTLLIGRRGSGKTALLNGYRYWRYLQKKTDDVLPDDSLDLADYDLVINISTHDHFRTIQETIAGPKDTYWPIESVVEEWKRVLVDYILVTLLAEYGDRFPENSDLESIRHYVSQIDHSDEAIHRAVWGPSVITSIRRLLPNWPRRQAFSERHDAVNQEGGLSAAVRFLSSVSKKALLIIDSMDE